MQSSSTQRCLLLSQLRFDKLLIIYGDGMEGIHPSTTAQILKLHIT
jgi:hypothetical protein